MLEAVHSYSLAGPFGWLPLTAAYLHANQLQPAWLLLQHAIAQAYASSCHAHSDVAADSHLEGSNFTNSTDKDTGQSCDSQKADKGLKWRAAQQLAQQWASLIRSMVEEVNSHKELTLLVFPAADTLLLGSTQVLLLQMPCIAWHHMVRGIHLMPYFTKRCPIITSDSFN